MSDDEHFEELSEQAKTNNISVYENSTATGLALVLWLHAPKLLKRPHTKVMILKPESFRVFPVGSKAS